MFSLGRVSGLCLCPRSSAGARRPGAPALPQLKVRPQADPLGFLVSLPCLLVGAAGSSPGSSCPSARLASHVSLHTWILVSLAAPPRPTSLASCSSSLLPGCPARPWLTFPSTTLCPSLVPVCGPHLQPHLIPVVSSNAPRPGLRIMKYPFLTQSHILLGLFV